MTKEIVLPPALYDRIKASAGEHGGIGRGALFSGDVTAVEFTGVPMCAHGHAWGTCVNKNAHQATYEHPELRQHLSIYDNDYPLAADGYGLFERVSFDIWCRLLNVKRGKDENYVTPPADTAEELVSA